MFESLFRCGEGGSRRGLKKKLQPQFRVQRRQSNANTLLSDALDLCRPFACWVSLACRLLSLFLCLSLAPYSKFVDMAINLSLVLYTTRIQKQFPLSFFAFIDSLAASVLQEAGGYAISRQNNLELHLGCHTCWMSYFTLVCLWCGWTVSRSVYGHVTTKFSWMGNITKFSYPWCSAARASRARALL